MGNYIDEFTNTPERQQKYKQRITSIAISQIHRSVRPSNQQTNWKLLQQPNNQNLDVENMYISKEPKQTYTYDDQQIKQSFNKVSNISYQEESILNLAFYNQLGLPEYTFKNQTDYTYKTINSENRSGVKYIGEWFNDKPHGNGIMKSNIQWYYGQFQMGLKHGFGRQILTNSVYEGQFMLNRRQGNGILYTPQALFKGIFNQQFVQGSITYVDGRFYEGEVKNGLYEASKAKLVTKQFTYEGGFKAGLMNGQGKIQYNDRRLFEGGFKDGQLHGYGVFVWDDKTCYMGNYYHDLKHDEGVLTIDGVKYNVLYDKGIEKKRVPQKIEDVPRHKYNPIPKQWQ